MKLASLNDGTRDGALMVVSRDLARCTSAAGIAPSLQAALDDWHRTEPALQALFADLQSGTISGQAFDQAAAHSPLPRASMGRRIGLCQSCAFGSQGAWCRNAGELLDRSVDVSGRIG